MYFGNRRPRGFRHTFRFVREQGEVTRRLCSGDTPEEIAADSERQYRQGKMEWSAQGFASSKRQGPFAQTGCLMPLVVLLLAIVLVLLLCR